MFAIDDHTRNVVTTVALFVIAGVVLYVARGAFFVLLLSLLFAYLLEPAVVFVQRHSRLGKQNRSWAIAQVYLIGTLLLGGLGYEFGPHFVAQMKSLNAALPQIVQGLSGRKTAADLGVKHGVSAAQQQQISDWLAGNQAWIARIFERSATSAAYVATKAVWLFVVPILAIFILQDGRQLADGFVEALGQGRDQTAVKRIVHQVDEMLAKYIRAQLGLAALSFAFYTVAMLILGIPYAIALGVLGGALEFLPAVGWIISAA